MSYLGIPPFGRTSRTVTEIVATAGQTTFYPTGGYTLGYIDVVLNGVTLNTNDFTATDGLSVVLAVAASLNDELHFTSYTVNVLEIDTSSLATVALSGSYVDLLNKPTIPSIAGLASETYVTTQISNLINGAPNTLDTLKEIADQLAADGGSIASIASSLATKANISSLAAVATSGNFSDLLSKPTTLAGYGITNGQPLDADLTAIAGLSGASGFLKKTALDTWALDTNTYLTGITSGQVTGALGFTPYDNANPSGYISGITSGNVTTALGFTPYNATNPSGYISGITSGNVTTALGFTPYNSTNPSGYITSSALTPYLTTAIAASTYQPIGSYLTGITSGQVTGALGFTPYNATNPSGYITGITSGNVTTALGYTPYNSSNPSGYITGITSGNVTSALGYTPYNATNPSGYITGYTETDTLATVTARGAATSGAITINSGTNDQGLTMTVSDASWNYIGFSHGATRKSYIGIDASGNPQWGSDSGAFNITGSYTTISTSTRSPIFYDSDNTSYYVDPASGSNISDLSITGSAHKYLTINPGNGYEAMVRYVGGSGSGWYVGKRTASELVSPSDFHLYSEAAGLTVFGIDTSGNTISRSSSRAPVFYDTDNTGYYLNPASTSNFNSVTASDFTGAINGMPNGGNSISGMGTASTWDPRPGGYYDRYAINWHTGISLSGYPSYGGVRLYSAGYPTLNSSTLRLEASTGVYTYGQFTNDNRIDVPIIYDYNDSSYYIDPNSQSRTNYISVNVGNENYGAANSSTAGLLMRGNYNSNTWAHKFHKYDAGGGVPLILSETVGAAAWNRVQSWGTSTGYSYTSQVYGSFNADSLYSTIYYDSNNTAYYTDPASTSVMNTVNVAALNIGGLPVTAGGGDSGPIFSAF